MLDLAGRIHKLEELKADDKKRENSPTLPHWPQNIDEEFKAGMVLAEKEAMKTLQLLGMLPELIQGNVLKQDGEEIVCINVPKSDTFAILDSAEPDENNVIEYEEVMELDNGVLLDVLEDDGTRNSLINLAVDASMEEMRSDSEDDDNSDEDEDNPKQTPFKSEYP
ncbi:hypothetical protein QZH41_002393 [Actinostola sp. cb2023]|nr:hypothetical protein QZH41_002393 [Actinostola sp. cb2023]